MRHRQNKKKNTYPPLVNFSCHPAVDLKYKETVSCWAILVGCVKISAHPVANLKLEIMAEWAKISAKATVQPWPPQRELLPELHHLGHEDSRHCTVLKWS